LALAKVKALKEPQQQERDPVNSEYLRGEWRLSPITIQYNSYEIT
jgi:hypothetical protein